MVTTELQDIKNNSPEQGRVKVVLRFPISVNLVLLRYETVLQKLSWFGMEAVWEVSLI